MTINVKHAGLLLIAVIILAYIILKPIVTHENEYKVVIVNLSEHKITKVEITGPEDKHHEMGAIRIGHIQDYIFTPEQNGVLEYSITQNKQSLRGVINSDLKRGDRGKIFVVIDEMYRVSIHDEFDI